MHAQGVFCNMDSNVADFKIHAKTRFSQDNFVEEIEFDLGFE